MKKKIDFNKIKNDYINQTSNELDSYSDMPDVQFSEKYISQKSRLIKTAEIRKKSSTKTKFFIPLVAILLCFILFVSCSKPAQDFIVTAWDKFTSYFIIMLADSSTDISDFEIEIDYIPNGYTLSEEFSYDNYKKYIFESGGDNSNFISITFDVSNTIQVNNDKEEVSVRTYYIDTNKCTITNFYDDETVTGFMRSDTTCIIVTCSLDDTEILKIIESINIKEKETTK